MRCSLKTDCFSEIAENEKYSEKLRKSVSNLSVLKEKTLRKLLIYKGF